MVDISQLLLDWSNGDESALNKLTPLVYADLRRMARAYLRGAASASLEPTVIVHEAFVRLLSQGQVQATHRLQFFALASKLMRSVLVDHLRRRQAAKRGGGEHAMTLSFAQGQPREDFDLVRLDEALNALAATRPRHGRIVELRFFGGLTIDETADVLGVSHATVERDWRLARAWLHRKLIQERAGPGAT
jgi:RNA polymerase sigma-70 factor (ECF subfamily)